MGPGLLVALIASVPPAVAAAEAAPAELSELQRRVESLQRQVEELKAQASPNAPAAAEGRLSWGGYGEFTLEHFAGSRQDGRPAGLKDVADLRRLVLYAGYHFNDWISFTGELETEHAGTGEGDEHRGEIAWEQAYVDFRLAEDRGWLQRASARAGLVLLPVGILNETHEPPTFHGVLRPSVETFIIPTTWRENGGGFVAQSGPVTVKSYVVTGLSAKNNADPATDGFSGASALRGSSTEGSKSFAEDLAWVTGVNVALPAGVVGGSLYLGEADQHVTPAEVPVALWEGHLRTEVRGAELRALYAHGHIGNPDSVNVANGVAAGSNGGVGHDFFGGYLEGAFDLLSLCPYVRGQYLAPFARYERYDTQQHVPNGWTNDPADSRVEYTLGLTYKPIQRVALKLDHQWRKNQARTGVDQWNFGLGFMF